MKFKYNKDFHKSFKQLPASIKKKFFNKLKLFIQNHTHPSLNLEKLEPKILNKWSLRIDRNYRLIFEFLKENTILLIDIGHHHKIYKKL